MNPSTAQLTTLVEKVTQIRDRNAELRRLKGENFNLFTILGLETAENKTHSAFLGALLDPRGSHGLGATLLQAFLTTIGYKGHLQADKATLTLEKHIGFRDDVAKTGGRIDLYLQDTAGHSIAIENKFYAGDQYAQLERYAKHNQDKTTVYYLNRDGSEPSEESKGMLEAEKGYHPINYRDHILRWLNTCIGLAADQPILRETIKQYRILIQKHTGQLSDASMNTEIHELIGKHYHAVKLLSQHVGAVEGQAVHDFLVSIQNRILTELTTAQGWEVTVDDDLHGRYKGITVTHVSWDRIVVRLQGEPYMIGGRSLYGIVAHKDTWEHSKILARLEKVRDKIALHEFKQSDWWPCWKWVDHFSREEGIAQLFDSGSREALVSHVAGYLLALAQGCEGALAGIERISGATNG